MFVSYALSHQVPLCQTTTLLPSVTWHQNVAVYWQGDSAYAARPPASTSNVVGQYHRTGGITFGATMYSWSCAEMCVWVRDVLLLSGTAGLVPCVRHGCRAPSCTEPQDTRQGPGLRLRAWTRGLKEAKGRT